MVYFAAYGCNNDSRKLNAKHGVSYHSFPQDKNLLREWLVKLARENFTVTKDSRICSQHFEPHCCERDLKSEMLGSPAKYNLKEDAIPTIFAHRPTKKPRLSSEHRLQEQAKREVRISTS